MSDKAVKEYLQQPVAEGHVVILPSCDGDAWTHALVVGPDLAGRPIENIHEIAESVMTAAKENVGDEWTWDDLEDPLRQAGFLLPNWSHGPQWD